METQTTTSSYELLKIILDFAGTIIWPIVVLVLILIFYPEIKKLLGKTKKLELPGGVAIEVDDEISNAKELAKEIKTERKPEIQTIIDKSIKKSETKANKRMFDLGLEQSPSGLDLNYYKRIADFDARLALIGLRVDFEMMLKNLSKGFGIPIEDKESISKINSKLLSKGAITTRQFEFINTVFRITNAAAHGAAITKKQVFEVLEIGQVLVDDYIAWLDWGFRDK